MGLPATYLPRWLIPWVARRDPAPPARVPVVLGWAGMRGAVSLFAALALPLTPVPFPDRGLVIYLTFTVILVTLVGQGLTLPALIRLVGVVDDGTVEHEETHARDAASEAALVRLEELAARSQGTCRSSTSSGSATRIAASTWSTTMATSRSLRDRTT